MEKCAAAVSRRGRFKQKEFTMPFTRLVAALLVLAYPLSSPAAPSLLSTGRFAESRFALVKAEGARALGRFTDGVTVESALKELSARDKAGAAAIEKRIKTDRIHPQEQIRFRSVRATPNGWSLSVPARAGTVAFTIGTAPAPALALAGQPLNPGAPLEEQYLAVRKILAAKPRGQALLDFVVPSAEANPVVILPAVTALGLVIAVQAVARFMGPEPEEALRHVFREGTEACTKEKVAPKAIYEGSETAALVGKLLEAEVIDLPGKAGQCTAFVAKMAKVADTSHAGLAACAQAELFLTCAEAFKKSARALPAPKTGGETLDSGASEVR